MRKLDRNFWAVNPFQKYFLNPVYCTLFAEGNVIFGMDTVDIHLKILLVCIYTEYLVTEHEGNMNMGQYCS